MAFMSARGVVKNYALGKTVVRALRGIDLDLERGEHLCVIGPSGAGKSTLLNILGLLDTPSEGTLEFDGMPVTAMKQGEIYKFRRERVAFIFQSFNLVPVLDAYENIELPLLIQKIPKAERFRRITRLSEEIGIAGLLSQRPDELSGGQRQRVAIARALATRPLLVLADEPTANLDSENGAAVLAIMRRLNREEGTTFVVASHDQAALREASRSLHVVDGLIAPG